MKFETIQLGEVCYLGDGAHAKVKRVEQGIPYLTSKNIKKGYLDLNKVDYISEEDYKRLFSPSKNAVRDLKSGDVLVGIIGTFGNVYLYNDSDYFGISSSIGIIRPNKEKILSDFLYFQIKSERFTKTVEMVKGGSVQGYTNIPTLKKMPIYITTLDNQRRIVNILNSLEQKIKLNYKIIENLEDIAQTVFKHWFIDFEFPNEEGLPYKLNGGKMVESEIGEMPEGWSVELLSSSTEFLSGGTPKTKESSYWNGDIPFFTPKDVGSSAYTTNTEKTITDLGLSKCNSKLYPKNTVFITARGTVGKVALANRDMAMNQSCFALKSKFNNQFFLYGVIQMLLREIIQGANGAVFNAINLADLNRLQVKMPSRELKERYESIVTPVFNQMSDLEFENLKLQTLRDTLLPKLLSGEIEIPDESEVD